MGIGSDFIEDLLRFEQMGILKECRSVVEIGGQQLASSFLDAGPRLQVLYDRLGIADGYFPQPDDRPAVYRGTLRHQEADAPPARDFYRGLGLRYSAVDVEGMGGTLTLDLNVDRVPWRRRGKFDLVTNFGTTEHVCNQLNAFRVIHDLVRPGGYMFHSLPMAGLYDHGLFNYNPKFFWMLCRANGYETAHMSVIHGGPPYPIPESITAFIRQFGIPPTWIDDFGVRDVGIKVMLRKAVDMKFVPPFDAPDEFIKETPGIRRRYGRVYGLRAKAARAWWRLREKGMVEARALFRSALWP